MHSHTLQASRLELAARFQIPQRDLRLLDPWVPVPIPVSFLVRKHAILANFGAVRVLISRCEVRALESERNGMYVPAMAYQMLDWGTHQLSSCSIPSPRCLLLLWAVSELARHPKRIPSRCACASGGARLLQCAILSSGRVDDQYVLTEEPDVNDKLTEGLRQMSTVSPQEEAPGVAPRRAGDHLHLPFELRMLEVALDEACGLMGVEVRGVVASATSRMAVLQASVVRTLPHAAATRAAPAHCGPLLASSGMEDSEHELRGRMQQVCGTGCRPGVAGKHAPSPCANLKCRVGLAV